MLTPELLARAERLTTAHLADGARTIGHRVRVADGRLRRITPATRFLGIAVTVRLTVQPGIEPHAEQALRVFEAGRSVERAVSVQQNGVPGYDTIGSFDARLAIASGYVAFVTDGSVRDTDELAGLGLPVHATAVGPECIRLDDLPTGHSIHFALGEPVEIAGIRIATGDVIAGDGDGVIAIDAELAPAIIAAAEAILDREQRLIDRLAAGAGPGELLGSEG